MKTRNLNSRQLKGFLKVADILACGDKDFPKFSNTDFYKKADFILDELPPDDLKGLKMLFSIFSVLPSFLIQFFMYLTEKVTRGPSFILDNFLKINSGLKGIVFTIYYSRLPGEGEKIFSLLGWNTKIPGYSGENVFHEIS